VTDVAANAVGTGPAVAVAPLGAWADTEGLDAERAGLLAPVPLDVPGPDAPLDPHPARPSSSAATAAPSTRVDATIAHLLASTV
jgi:hypothetical protein